VGLCQHGEEVDGRCKIERTATGIERPKAEDAKLAIEIDFQPDALKLSGSLGKAG